MVAANVVPALRQADGVADVTWNFRVVRHEHNGEPWFTLHEVYYEADGSPKLWNPKAYYPVGETVDELRADIDRLKLALDKPVFDVPKGWK